VHQVLLHPWFVAWAWWKLYGFPWDPRLWVAFIVHDWGYWGQPNMDGPEGETHIWTGAGICGWLFDREHPLVGRVARVLGRACDRVWGHEPHGDSWFCICFYHSRFIAKRYGRHPSRLCAADKLAIGLTPAWLYLRLATLSGELAEYMAGTGARSPAGDRTPAQWYSDVRRYCSAWAHEHADCKPDTWTGTKRDLARP
jgi:hypothetical protein